MDIYDQILENLELERELGTRTVEIDRALLVPPKPEQDQSTPEAANNSAKSVSSGPGIDGDKRDISGDAGARGAIPGVLGARGDIPGGAGARGDAGDEASASAPSSVAETAASPSVACDMLFLSGRPLSAAGQEAMRKTVTALKKIKPDVTVRLNENVPAKVMVLLGSDALKGRSAVSARPVRGRWMAVEGVPALPTFSPDYIFSHFQEGSPGMVAAKRDMWNDIKAALARL